MLCSIELDRWYLTLTVILWLTDQLNSAADAECTLAKYKTASLKRKLASWVRSRSDHVPTIKKTTRLV